MRFGLFSNHILRILLFKIGNGFLYRKYSFLINLFFLKVRAVYGQGHDEFRSPVFLALHFNASSMQLHQVLYQRKADARTNGVELPVIPLVEPLEEALLFVL